MPSRYAIGEVGRELGLVRLQQRDDLGVLVHLQQAVGLQQQRLLIRGHELEDLRELGRSVFVRARPCSTRGRG